MASNDPNNLDDQDFMDDDLLDQDDLGDVYDDETYDENWEDTQPQKAVKPKKKFSIFNLVVFGIAGIIAIGILMSVFSGGSDSSNPELGAPSQEITTAQPAVPPATELGSLQNGDVPAPVELQQESDPSNSQGFMNDPTLLDQGSQTTPSLPEQGPSMTAPIESAPSQKLPVPQNLPNIDQIKKADPVKAQPTPQLEQTAETTVPVAAPVIQDVGLQSKLDQLITRMESLEKKITEQPVPSINNNSAEISELKSAIERLETRVSRLSDSPAPKPQISTSYNEEPSKVVVKKSPPKRKIAATKPKAASKWELRSARPGEAMVGKSGEAGLQTIRVGDSISGIGQVQSISQSGGRWVVQGSTGSIGQ